jgi:hypothetical protein
MKDFILLLNVDNWVVMLLFRDVNFLNLVNILFFHDVQNRKMFIMVITFDLFIVDWTVLTLAVLLLAVHDLGFSFIVNQTILVNVHEFPLIIWLLLIFRGVVKVFRFMEAELIIFKRFTLFKVSSLTIFSFNLIVDD